MTAKPPVICTDAANCHAPPDTAKKLTVGLTLGWAMLVAVVALGVSAGAIAQQVRTNEHRIERIEKAIESLPAISADVSWLRAHAERRDAAP